VANGAVQSIATPAAAIVPGFVTQSQTSSATIAPSLPQKSETQPDTQPGAQPTNSGSRTTDTNAASSAIQRPRGPGDAAAPHRRAASHPDSGPVTTSLAGDLQPVMTLREVGGQTPAHGHAIAESDAAQPGQTDLGTLVDRLIAARDVGGSKRVGASIAHTDFGRIELSFTPDASGMTVGMHSRDPDFAPSVQAAASFAPVDPTPAQSTSSQTGSNLAGSSGMEAGSHGSTREQARDASPEPQAPVRTPRATANRSTDRGEPGGIYA
jgi:hypothetical protein